MKSSVLLALVVVLLVAPFVIHRNGPAPEPSAAVESADEEGGRPGGEAEKLEVFAGEDVRASKLIESLRPGYKPWATPLFEPPSGEVETALFAIQAALGAGVLFYYLGYARGRARAEAAAAAAASSASSASSAS